MRVGVRGIALACVMVVGVLVAPARAQDAVEVYTNRSPVGPSNKLPVDVGTITIDTSLLATAAKQDTTNTNLGAPGATVCATDTGSCSFNALMQRANQRLTSILGVIGAPMQASGGSVQANAGTNLNTSLLALEGGGNLATIASRTPSLGQASSANSRPVVLPTDPDIRPASGTITVQDTGSAAATGQNSASIITGSPTANSTQSQAINGQSGARILVTGTWTGTLTFEGSVDSGTTWTPIPARVVGSSYTQGSVTGNGHYDTDVSGLTNVRARATAAMTGTATVRFVFTATAGAVQVLNPVRIFDNTSGAQATVKPGSTLPSASDTAVVVTVRDPVTATQGTYVSAGAQQNALAVTTNTQLTVPANTKCAYITVETASVRRTSDTTSASTTNGTLFAAGAQWSDCGPLAAYKFTAVSGSPTLTVEYFK